PDCSGVERRGVPLGRAARPAGGWPGCMVRRGASEGRDDRGGSPAAGAAGPPALAASSPALDRDRWANAAAGGRGGRAGPAAPLAAPPPAGPPVLRLRTGGAVTGSSLLAAV